MNQPICPYCHEEMIDGDDGDYTSNFFCCVCKLMIAVFDMTDANPCEKNEEDDS